METIDTDCLASNVADLREALAEHLDGIKSCFKDGRVTLIVRSPAFPKGTVVMGDDDLDLAIASVKTLRESPGTTVVAPDTDGSA